LSRADLANLRGLPSQHVPYKLTDIMPWIDPIERHIPPFRMPDPSQPVSKVSAVRATGQTIDSNKLDFGGEDGLFRVWGPYNLCMLQVDFGGADGLFRIPS